MLKANFNTGRHYAADGQRILADFNPLNCVVRFMDLSRGIDGQFNVANSRVITSGWELQQQVMHHYDTNDYRGFDGWQDKQKMLDSFGVKEGASA